MIGGLKRVRDFSESRPSIEKLKGLVEEFYCMAELGLSVGGE